MRDGRGLGWVRLFVCSCVCSSERCWKSGVSLSSVHCLCSWRGSWKDEVLQSDVVCLCTSRGGWKNEVWLSDVCLCNLRCSWKNEVWVSDVDCLCNLTAEKEVTVELYEGVSPQTWRCLICSFQNLSRFLLQFNGSPLASFGNSTAHIRIGCTRSPGLVSITWKQRSSARRNNPRR